MEGEQLNSSETKTSANLLIPALASMVLSQARISVVENQSISGLDRKYGARNGLSTEERMIMAMVSRHCLAHGLPDYGGEVHDLLYHCTLPLDEWLKTPEVIATGFGSTRLIDADSGIPTVEAQELAIEFSSVSAQIEEELFARLKEALAKFPPDAANEYYTFIREFIVRNPVTHSKHIYEAGQSLPATLWMAIHSEFYEPVPAALATGGKVTLCAHCRSLLKQKGAYTTCQSVACSSSHACAAGDTFPVDELRRVTRGIRQFWVEPGLDEIRLFDALKAQGFQPTLYPKRDVVDIACGKIGMDLKMYASPEILGAKFRRSIGGLAQYEKKWLVIPDWLLATTASYLDRLKAAMGDALSRVEPLSLKQAIARAGSEA